MTAAPLLEVREVRVCYGPRRAPVHAVDGVSFTLAAGESLGLVGESGCGKSTLGRALLRLEPLQNGRIVFAGVDISALRDSRLKSFRGQAQMIFQDPHGALNPRLSVGSMLGEALAAHRRCRRAERAGRVADLLRAGLVDQADFIFTMTRQQQDLVQALYPAAAEKIIDACRQRKLPLVDCAPFCTT